MNRFNSIAIASCLGLATMVPNALADQWNKKTILTVNEPIQVPGKVLQPGKYVMKLMDSPSNRHIVQIFNDRENEIQTTILAIPNYRLQPTGKTEFQWWEVPAGQPKALRAWFYPGDNFGQEFAYPKTASVAIAAVNTAPVPTTYSTSDSDLASARVGTVDKSGNEAELTPDYTRQDSNTQAQATAETPQQTEVAQAAPPAAEPAPAPVAVEPAPAPAQENTVIADSGTRMRTLPRTASPVPLVGLAGFLALGASMAVRAIAKRS